MIGFFYVRSRGKGVAGRFIPRRKERREISLKLQGNNLWKSLKIRRKYSLKRENKVEMGLFVHRIVLLCAESPLFYGFREYFHKQNDRYFTILWKFDEKVQMNYCILVKRNGIK